MIPPHWPKPTNDKLEKVYEALHNAGSTFGGGQDFSCPAHGDERASLGVIAGDSQPVLFKCQAGCTTPQILEALGLKPEDISNGSKAHATKTKALVETRKWVYSDEVGHPLIAVWRMDYSDGSKDYRQGNAALGKPGSITGIRDTLYHLPALIRTVAAGGGVWLVEGEKSADALDDVLPNGEVATTQRMGASQPWPDDFTEALRGAGEVRVVADFDAAGFKRALAVARALNAEKIPVTVWRGAVEAKGADIVDHLAAMKTQSDLVRLTSRDLKAQIKAWEDVAVEPTVTEVPEDGDEWPSSATPYSVAMEWVNRYHSHPDAATLAYWREDFYEWSLAENRFKTIEDIIFEQRLYRVLDKAYSTGANGPIAWRPTDTKIKSVQKALKAFAAIPSDVESVWRDSFAPANTLSFKNGNLDLASMTFDKPSPNLFNPIALPYDYDPQAKRPETWLWFLEDLWPNDKQSRELLREWFGYVISGSLALDKMLVLFGAPRSGKSTIAKVLEWLIGKQNTISPTFKTLSNAFGLSDWLNKPLAIFQDARFNPKDTEAVLELLLAISSGNPVEIQRKFKSNMSVVLPTRMFYVSNEYPRIQDASGALHARFLFLETTRSHTGHEDRTIPERLRGELPGIMAWALRGMQRVIEKEHFTEVESMHEISNEIARTQSLIESFFEDACEPNGFTSNLELYSAYQTWCSINGISYVWSSIEFGRQWNARYRENYRKTSKRLTTSNYPVSGYAVTLKKNQYRV